MMFKAYVATCTALLCAACGNSAAEEPQATSDFRVETVVENVEVPWSIVFTSKDRMLFTERAGRVRLFENGQLRREPMIVLDDVRARSEAGLMGMCLHPDYATNKFVYLAYTSTSENGNVRVVRFRDNGTRLVEPSVIISRIPAAQNHAGCRIRFGPDKKLYITTGDALDMNIAQRLDSLGGKILRINDDGTVPSDNPFVNQPNARPEIWSYGHRNPQGIDWQPGTNLLFSTEHGPSGFEGKGGGGDEVNIVERGKNYGWPIIHHNMTRDGMVSPLLEYTPAEAPASGTFYRGELLAKYKNNFFFGCLVGNGIIRVELDGRRVVSQEKILKELGRIREVVEGPDGAIYFSTSNRDGRGNPARNDDRIMRIVPR